MRVCEYIYIAFVYLFSCLGFMTYQLLEIIYGVTFYVPRD